MICVALICAVCVMKLGENRNLNVMTEDNDEDDDDLVIFKKYLVTELPGIKLYLWHYIPQLDKQ